MTAAAPEWHPWLKTPQTELQEDLNVSKEIVFKDLESRH